MKGKLHTEDDRKGLIDYILKLDLSRVCFWEIKRQVKRRTISQNRLLFLWYACLSDELGYEVYELHELFKRMFLPGKVIEWDGKEISIHTTKTLNTAQFTQYLYKIQITASQQGIHLPNPDDLIFDSFMEQYKDRI